MIPEAPVRKIGRSVPSPSIHHFVSQFATSPSRPWLSLQCAVPSPASVCFWRGPARESAGSCPSLHWEMPLQKSPFLLLSSDENEDRKEESKNQYNDRMHTGLYTQIVEIDWQHRTVCSPPIPPWSPTVPLPWLRNWDKLDHNQGWGVRRHEANNKLCEVVITN